MSEADRLAAAAAAYAAVPEPVKPGGQHPDPEQQLQPRQGRTVLGLAEAVAGKHPFMQQQGMQSAGQSMKEAQSNWEGKQGRAPPVYGRKLPGIEEIESVLAAYDAAGVFASGDAQEGKQAKPLLHFMMAPQHGAAAGGFGSDAAAAGSGGDIWAGGAVLHQGPPQVTAVAQVCG